MASILMDKHDWHVWETANLQLLCLHRLTRNTYVAVGIWYAIGCVPKPNGNMLEYLARHLLLENHKTR